MLAFAAFLSVLSSLSRTLIFISLIGRLWEQIFLNSSAPIIHVLLPMTLDLSSTIKNHTTNFPTQKFPTGNPVWVSLDIRADVSSVFYNFLLVKWVCKFMWSMGHHHKGPCPPALDAPVVLTLAVKAAVKTSLLDFFRRHKLCRDMWSRRGRSIN